MPTTWVWIPGASGGIGRARAETVPPDDAPALGISRGRPPNGDHLEADLADPASWLTVAASFNSAVVDLRSLREDGKD